MFFSFLNLSLSLTHRFFFSHLRFLLRLLLRVISLALFKVDLYLHVLSGVLRARTRVCVYSEHDNL
jgi:hypothetical protein